MYDSKASGTTVTLGQGANPPEPDNDNWGVGASWQTPAEALQLVRRIKNEIRQELHRDFRLRACPTHRLHWHIINEMEKCALWQYYGIRSDDQ